MISKKIKNIEFKAQKVWKKESPSYYPVEYKRKFLDKNMKFMTELYLDKLNLPPQFLKKKDLLDFGCGSGEYSSIYFNWGMNCTFVEANIKSCNRFKFLTKKLKIKN